MTAAQSIRLFEIFLPIVKEESKAKEIITNIEDVIENRFDKEKEILATKHDILEMKTEIMKTIYVVGLVQFLAIIGSVIAIMSFIMK
ncbi:MAG: hypothetical protein RLZZ175_959 [Bacteroidota bacterium]|jgi:ABC-type antimicrobial peptide transport system permease subunit